MGSRNETLVVGFLTLIKWFGMKLGRKRKEKMHPAFLTSQRSSRLGTAGHLANNRAM